MAYDSKGQGLKVGDFIDVHGRSASNYTCPRAVVVKIEDGPNIKDRIFYRPSAEPLKLTNWCRPEDCTLIHPIKSFMASLIEKASALCKDRVHDLGLELRTELLEEEC